jgi:hypothetical protein
MGRGCHDRHRSPPKVASERRGSPGDRSREHLAFCIKIAPSNRRWTCIDASQPRFVESSSPAANVCGFPHQAGKKFDLKFIFDSIWPQLIPHRAAAEKLQGSLSLGSWKFGSSSRSFAEAAELPLGNT